MHIIYSSSLDYDFGDATRFARQLIAIVVTLPEANSAELTNAFAG
jgi:hypothetical protein